MSIGYKHKNQEPFVAPDGGWGWMVVLGSGIGNMVLISALQSFGLMNKDRFLELQFSVMDIATLVSMNSSFGMILCIFSGPLLKQFGYRKVALLGGVLFVSGMYYTAFAENYIQFLISYGMVSSMGTSLCMSAYSLALNTYFKLKRNLASSFSMTIMGMGPITLPLLITRLLSSYGWKWTVLIVSANSMNTIVGGLLLQPVKWHLQPRNPDDREQHITDPILEKLQKRAGGSSTFGFDASYLDLPYILNTSQVSLGKWSQHSFHLSRDSVYQKIPGTKNKTDVTRKLGRRLRSVASLDNEDYGDMMKSTLFVLESSTPNEKLLKYASVETLDQNVDEKNVYEAEKLLSSSLDMKFVPTETLMNNVLKDSPNNNKKGFVRKIANFINLMYDLDLFLDPVYINLLIGLSVATVGEIIFSLLTPFILTELGLTLEETSFFMSLTGIADVIFRFLSPFFGRCCNFSSRIMYILSISLLLITRASLLLASNLTGYVVVALFLGVGKGFRTVYWNLVVPDYVPLDKLASASAFQSLCNGLSLLISGPIIGTVVSKSGNKYSNVIFASNFLSFITIVMWSIEFLIVYRKNKKTTTLPR